MISQVRFRNFKALRETALPLSPFTLIVGPNGSGKSSVFQALQGLATPGAFCFSQIATADLRSNDKVNVEVAVEWGSPFLGFTSKSSWDSQRTAGPEHCGPSGPSGVTGQEAKLLGQTLDAIRVYSFDPQAIAAPVRLLPSMTLDDKGMNLAGVLDLLLSSEPERFEALNLELGRWLPEFDRVLLEVSFADQKSLLLRTRNTRHKIPATALSQGTLLALAILTLAHIPDPPPLVCIEEPDRGIHPRLLRDVRDAMYRLSHPESGGEKRAPVQVISTTHSPYLLDLYDDHPEEVVIAQKVDQDVHFERLSERPDIDEILHGAQLGEVWYSGILGGVPANT